jgi:hypothetical protein
MQQGRWLATSCLQRHLLPTSVARLTGDSRGAANQSSCGHEARRYLHLCESV